MAISSRRVRRSLVGLFFVASLVGADAILVAQQDKQEKDKPLTGQDLFERCWEVLDPLCPLGDGLGPCFNAVSCVACHNQGSTGGGGDFEHNVDVLTIQTPPDDLNKAANGPRRTPLRLHPDFLNRKASIVLHRFGAYSDYEFYRFDLLNIEYSRDLSPSKRALFWASMAKKQHQAPAVEKIEVSGIRFQLTHRNTPALFGSGLIDTIPAEAIRDMELQQESAGGAISGRISRAKPSARDPFVDRNKLVLEKVGRFGWRGQTSTLADFVLGACANELGLQTPLHNQPINPLAPNNLPQSPDLDENKCQELIRFVRELPRPTQIKPKDPKAVQVVERGEKLFHRVGCAACHADELGGVAGLYSDLLLHDMGRELADPLPAMPKVAAKGQDYEPTFGYYGAVTEILAEIPTETKQEWRTPPLWGIADSAPYLHDGRAKNLHQAIVMHGGEAKVTVDRYQLLPGTERDSLIAFLATLKAPRQN